MNESEGVDVARRNKRHVLGWLLSAVLGTVVAFVSSGIVLPLVFGLQKRDSASVWMLSGAADFVMGLFCLPAFWLVHGFSYAMLKGQDAASWRSYRSLFQGLILFWIVLVLAWRSSSGGPVLRAE